ncbi:MAG: polysaccharide biosynthesis tyrosine autokinase [Candidatus Competibacteraceae bacterium]
MQNENIVLEPPERTSGRALAEWQQAPSPYFLEPSVDKQSNLDESGFLDAWRIIVKRKWTILTCLFITVVTVVTATFLMTPIYRSTLTLQIEREPQKIVQYQSSVENEPDAYQGYESFYKTQYELLKSRSLAQRIIDLLGLSENPIFMGKEQGQGQEQEVPFWKTLFEWIRGPQQKEETVEKQKDKPDLAKMFLSDLFVEPVRDSRLVKISYESPSPELATTIVNTLADTYINMSMERRFEASSYARKFLEERLQQIKAKLEDSERDLAQYARRNQIITLDERQNIINKTVEELNTALAKAEADRIKAEADYQQAQRTDGQGLSPILDNLLIGKLQEIKAGLDAQYQDELNVLKPGYPKMQQLSSRINQIQIKINEEVAKIRAAIRAKYEAAKTNQSLLQAKLNEAKNELMEIQQRSIQFNILKREVDTNRQLYDGLLQRYKEVGVAGGVGTNNIFVIDKAEIPQRPFKPSLFRNTAIAIFMGLFVGVLLAFLFDALDKSIKPEELERVTGIPALGMIPRISQSTRRIHKEQPLALLAYQDPRSTFAESYRSVRTALQFSTVHGAPRIIAVTSAQPKEGKTTVSITLAITFAQAGKKVLLIDADLRNPSLHRLLQLDNSMGLTNYLAADAQPVEVAYPVLLENLFVIPSGPLPPNPVELLSTPKMAALLSLATEKFDQVILDCPPVLGLADALILGNMAQATLLVMEAGVTPRPVVQDALKRLRSARAHILGGVVNKLDSRSHSYGYHYHYHYYYSYDERSANKRLAT